MADPTPDQLVAFFTAVKQLRTIFGAVVIRFAGNNTLPVIGVTFNAGDPISAGKTVQVASDSVDDLTAAMNQLYVDAEHEGQLRQQLADLEKQAATLRVQLGSR